MNKNDWSLLPYEYEELYGFDAVSSQHIGWEIEKLNIKNSWKYSEGEGVVVAVIDTGCDLYHEDLKDNLVQGINFVEKNKDPIDKAGHGTHVAGTIAAKNNHMGIVGVAPKSKIMPIKALNDEGRGGSRSICDSIIWAVDNKADFITMSLGSPNPEKNIENAINYANSKGCIIFCAAGNSGHHTPIMYPANYSNVISIGAIDQNLERTSFTCSGEELDFLAPGHDIVGCFPENKYSIMSGTSMSNPFAVGCASLLLSYNRKYNKYILNNVNDYINIFKSVALQTKRYESNKAMQGYGIIRPVIS